MSDTRNDEEMVLLSEWGNLLDDMPEVDQQIIKNCFNQKGAEITGDIGQVKAALFLAVEKKYPLVLQHLLNKGANLFMIGEYPDSVFADNVSWKLSAVIELAAEKRNIAILKIIVEHLIERSSTELEAINFARAVLVRTKNVVLGLPENASSEERATVRKKSFSLDQNVKAIEKMLNENLRALQTQVTEIEKNNQSCSCVIS